MALLNANNYAKIARGTGGLTAPSVPKIKSPTLLNPENFTPTKTITYTPTTGVPETVIPMKSPIPGMSDEEYTAAFKKPENYAESRYLAEKQQHIKTTLWAQALQKEQDTPETGLQKTASVVSKVLKTVYTPVQAVLKAPQDILSYGGTTGFKEAGKDIASIPQSLYNIWTDKERGTVSGVLTDVLNTATTGLSLYLYGSMVKQGIDVVNFQKAINDVGSAKWNEQANAIDTEYLARQEGLAKETVLKAHDAVVADPNTSVGFTADGDLYENMVAADKALKDYTIKNGATIDYSNKEQMNLIFARNNATGDFLRSFHLVDLSSPETASSMETNAIVIPASPTNTQALALNFRNTSKPVETPPVSPTPSQQALVLNAGQASALATIPSAKPIALPSTLSIGVQPTTFTVKGIPFNVSKGNADAIKEFSNELSLTPAKFSLSKKTPEELANSVILYSPTEKAGAIIQKADYSYYEDGGNVQPGSLEIASVFRHGTTKGAGNSVMIAAIDNATMIDPKAPIVLDCFNTGGLPRFYEKLGFKKIDTIPYNPVYADENMKKVFPNGNGPDVFIMQLDKDAFAKLQGEIPEKQAETNSLIEAANNQGISLPSMTGTTSVQGAKDAAIGNFAKAINRNINIAGTQRNIDFSGFHWGARTFKVSDGANIIAPDGIDTIGAATALTDAYRNEPDKLKIRTIRYDLESKSGSEWNHQHAGFSATGRDAAVIQNELDKGFVVVRLIANATGCAPKVKALKEAGITELWTAFKNNQTFIDTVQERMPDFLENHPDFQPRGLNGKPITVDERLGLTQLANDISSDFNKERAGKISGVAVIAKNGIIDVQQTSWNEFDKHVLGHYPTIIGGAYFEFNDPSQMPLYDDIIAGETPISGFGPKTYKAPFLESLQFNISNPEIKKLMDTVVSGTDEFRRQVGLSSSAPVIGVQTNTATPPQPESSTTLDPSKYTQEPPTEQVVSSINGALRPGYINITSVAHLVNTPARTFNQLLNNDPLKIGLDKLGFYDLLYGKETNAELQAGQGNPSLWNFGFVPASVKNVMLWGELFTAQTRMTFKDITVEADLERDDLIGFDRAAARLSKDEFVQLLWDIKNGGTGIPLTQQPIAPTNTQQLADRYIAISKRAEGNLIAAGLDPQIFARLQGHYLPSPSDELGQDILPTIDEKQTVKPSLGFIEKQRLPQEVIIGLASQDDTWQDYRDYMVSRMAAEIRAGEKGRFFGAIAADPHTNAINTTDIDYNTGKRVAIPKDYVVFSLGGERKSFALDGYAVPKWVALFINNEFTSKAAMEQMKGVQELLGQWKWNKAIINIPTLVRNIISQLTFQSLESGLSVFNLDDYIIRPLGALLGLNKADQKELVNLGIINSGLTRDLEGLGWSPQERALWQSGQDRGLKLGMIYDKFKTVRNSISSVYSFSDNLTKAGAYYAARRNFDSKTARVLSSLTTGDYSQRAPIVNYLTRGIYNGHINPFAMVFSSPFAFFKLIVEPQRAGNLVRYHPTLLVAGLLAAALGIKGLIKKIQRQYGMSEAAASAVVNQFENYYWLNGKYVVPTGKDEGIDVTSMIPMLNFISEAKKALVAEKTISQVLATANSLFTGVNSANFILETLVSLSTGNDLNYFLQYGTVKSIGKTNVEQLNWLLQQFSPTWLNKLLNKKPNGKDFSLDDLIGQYKVSLSEADKAKAWHYIMIDPTISDAEKRRTAAAYFGPSSLEQLGWNRIMGK